MGWRTDEGGLKVIDVPLEMPQWRLAESNVEQQ